MMKYFQYGLYVLLLTVLGGCTSASYPTTDFPEREGLERSGTFVVREDQVMLVAAGAAGEGTLMFQGWEHPFHFEGAKLGAIGHNPVEIHGAVYNLESIENFEGQYRPTQAEFGAGEGLTGAWGKNDKGVVLYVNLEGHDMEVNKEAAGARVTLK